MNAAAVRKKAATDPVSLTAGDYRRVFLPNIAWRGRLASQLEGANATMVGPGLAYETWRNTLEYRGWLAAFPPRLSSN